ncbi:MAG: cytochrome c biogenesis protein ResB [Porphyromonadaceae bacterium]|nr:cytochrome c biogenesis protein ResB [Porphyromonadaceae bacterium]
MWKHPWTYKEGLTIGIGLVLTGILLQISIGAFNTDFLRYPSNAIIGILYIISIIFLFSRSKKSYLIRWMSGMEASITSIAVFLALVIIMGLTRQYVLPEKSGAMGWLGFKNMLSAWSFVLVFIYMLSVLGLATLRRIKTFRWKKDIPFVLNHVGLFIALTSAVLGSADMRRYQMVVEKNVPEWRATDENGEMVEMDLAIELNDFTIDEYPPKLMLIDNESGRTLPENQPVTLLVDKERIIGSLLDWDIEVSNMLENSAPMIGKDSVHFVEFYSEGAAAAVYVTAKNRKQGNSVSGWVSSGSYLYPYHALKLDERMSLVMPDREPKRYASDVTVYTKDEKKIDYIIEVNKPLKVNGWKIYQISYDERMGKWSKVSKFELVRDPWLWLVYVGIVMMILGAVGLFVVGKSPLNIHEK